MSKEQRTHIRTALACHVKVVHPLFGEKILLLRDLSEGGVFIETPEPLGLSEGDEVSVQIQGLMDAAPILTMVIVRVTPHGLGLCFGPMDIDF